MYLRDLKYQFMVYKIQFLYTYVLYTYVRIGITLSGTVIHSIAVLRSFASSFPSKFEWSYYRHS